MFALQRALVQQRVELKAVTAALADVVFGWDPLAEVMDKLPRSIIVAQTSGGEVRTRSGVPWIALETITLSAKRGTLPEPIAVATALEALAGKPWYPSAARSSADHIPCVIWSAEMVGQPVFRVAASAVIGARDILIRWQGYASWWG